jgi:pilus assembly protein CpaE
LQHAPEKEPQMSTMPTPQDPGLIRACTISRDVQAFDLLIEDMDSLLGTNWGDINITEALAYLAQPEAKKLEFLALALEAADEAQLDMLVQIVAQAQARQIGVILIAEDVSPATLHHLLRAGAREFVPYPLPEGELQAALSRLQAPPPTAPGPTQTQAAPSTRPAATGGRDGVILAVQGLAGGTGATTLAINLAWELANIAAKGETAPRVCLLDFDLQYGGVSTYLDLPRREAVFELLSDTEAMDFDSFSGAMLPFENKLQVLTAPADMIPLDLISAEDVNRLVGMARDHFDYVLIDMPRTLVMWTEAVLNLSQIYFAMIELDMRSAQNALRLKRLLQSEDMAFDKLRFALNRAPKFTDISGKGRVKRMAESLGISIDLLLSDGGRAVTQANDGGTPLALAAAKNPLRKDIAKLAQSLHALGQNGTSNE